jgi:hypothetical protein
MAILNLLEIQPTRISRSLQDKYILLYGGQGVGKTSFAAQCKDNLLLAFEKGYNGIAGVYPAKIEKWPDFKAILQQLNKAEVRERYKTVTFDTINIAYSLCERYICEQNDVDTIGKIPYGQGYTYLSNEFSNSIRRIVMMDYGIIFLAHSKIKNIPGPNETQIETYAPSIPDRAQETVNALVDIIAYIKRDINETGEDIRTIITGPNPRILTKSRFKYLAPQFPLGYQNFVEAMNEAINIQERIEGIVATENPEEQEIIKKRPFKETFEEAKTLWEEYVGEEPERAEQILSKVEQLFGYRIKLSEIPESKQDLFEILIEEIKSM